MNTLRAHRARRTARSAVLVAVAAAAAFTLTACGGGGSGSEDGAAANETKTSAGNSQAVMVSDSSKAVSPHRTQKLVDGSTAKSYKLGSQHYRVDIVSDGAVVGDLEANGEDTGLDANGMFVVLTLDGKVHSWMGGEHQGPGTFKVAGGWTVKVTKVGELHYRAEVLGNEGAVEGTLEADQHDDGAVANGVYIVLSAGGEISAHE